MNNLFEPVNHHFPTSLFFEDLRVGEKYYIPSRTLSDANFAAFQLASADNHPIHYDIESWTLRVHLTIEINGREVLNTVIANGTKFLLLFKISKIIHMKSSDYF